MKSLCKMQEPRGTAEAERVLIQLRTKHVGPVAQRQIHPNAISQRARISTRVIFTPTPFFHLRPPPPEPPTPSSSLPLPNRSPPNPLPSLSPHRPSSPCHLRLRRQLRPATCILPRPPPRRIRSPARPFCPPGPTSSSFWARQTRTPRRGPHSPHSTARAQRTSPPVVSSSF